MMKEIRLQEKLWNEYFELKDQLHNIQQKLDNKLIAIKTIEDQQNIDKAKKN